MGFVVRMGNGVFPCISSYDLIKILQPTLKLNLHMTRGIYSERTEGERSIAFFLWSRIMARKEQTRRMKAPSVNSEQFWATFSKSSEPKH